MLEGANNNIHSLGLVCETEDILVSVSVSLQNIGLADQWEIPWISPEIVEFW